MKPRTVTPMGSLHPVLFFAGLYVVALLFSIFICSSLFYSCNSNSAQSIGDTEPVKEMTSPAAGQVASR